MTDTHLSALRDHLSDDIQDAKDILAILVQIRNVIDDMPDGRYPILEFFCDWLLHAKLDRKNAKTILEKFDSLITQVRADPGTRERVVDTAQPLITFSKFRSELLTFLTEHALELRLAADLDVFGPFLFLYVGLIEKTPLVAHPKLKLPNLDTLRVSLQPVGGHAPAPPDHRYMFSIEWTALKSGKEIYSFLAEVWFPEQPVSVTVELTGESNTFWN